MHIEHNRNIVKGNLYVPRHPELSLHPAACGGEKVPKGDEGWPRRFICCGSHRAERAPQPASGHLLPVCYGEKGKQGGE
jgi:hypothetical protein